MHSFYQDSTRKRRKCKRKKKKETHKIDVTPPSDRDKNPFSNLIAALLTRLADFSSRLIYHLKVFLPACYGCVSLFCTRYWWIYKAHLFSQTKLNSIIQIMKSSKLSNTFDVHGNISLFFSFSFFSSCCNFQYLFDL